LVAKKTYIGEVPGMKKLTLYVALMLAVVVLLPLFIVKGFYIDKPVGKANEREETGNSKQQETVKEKVINVFFHEDQTVKEMPLEEYLLGVVAAEMPAEFELEALKAQAVASRTYAYYKILYGQEDPERHNNAHICTDSTHCQAWTDKDTLFSQWGEKAEKYWDKIKKAVSETENIVVTYDRKIINPVFHANSGGRTENAEEVWAGEAVPYLKSVPSSGDEIDASYKSIVIIERKKLFDTVKKAYPQLNINEEDILDSIRIEGRTEGGSVKEVVIGNVSIKGTEFRNLFGLRSADFYIEPAGKNAIQVTIYGHGHGVGMSQWGANAMAKDGAGYAEILKHYYTGTGLSRIKN